VLALLIEVKGRIVEEGLTVYLKFQTIIWVDEKWIIMKQKNF
jgi:hypothetical protein